ncbi:hypothetical protein EUGRSUZ_K02511 [Eucalyptus grandis]|uniref:Uncharacterized protein n=2 Tax=Eucalyptus grandis TaxID=71139 RepID=A0ACC3IWM8_EUCGR|nr:hypothetical protein EUGRSUZ_K02511 [Eucalyptus grandis]
MTRFKGTLALGFVVLSSSFPGGQNIPPGNEKNRSCGGNKDNMRLATNLSMACALMSAFLINKCRLSLVIGRPLS